MLHCAGAGETSAVGWYNGAFLFIHYLKSVL